jgi:diguanylate cyclase (GGDEF)-like protein
MQSVLLEFRTVIFISTGIASFSALGLFAFGIFQNKFKGFPLLASAGALTALSLFFIGYRGILPDSITIIFVNLLLIIAIIFYYEGLRRFLEHATKFHPISIITIVVGFILFMYFTYQVPSVSARVLIISAITVIISALCVLELIRGIQKSWRIPGFVTIIVFAGHGLYSLFRLLWTLEESPIKLLMTAETVHALVFFSLNFLTTGSTFGFIWIVSKKLENNLRDLAMHDQLTKILNRKGVNLFSSKEFAKVERKEIDLSIVMIDIDRFKQVNDQYGHSVGDRLLSEFAKLVQNNLRPYDILGRIGGEEFLVLLPNTNLGLAHKLADRIRKEIERTVFKIDTTEIQITASFGVSICFQKTNTLEKLMPFADMALFQSKKQGRNRVSSLLPPLDEKQ